MRTIDQPKMKTKVSNPGAPIAKALLCGLTLAAAGLQAAPLSEADIIRQLQARPAATAPAADPDEVFANDAALSKGFSRFKAPDTHGACLDEPAQGAGHKALAVIALAPAGAPQVNLTLQFALGKYQLTKADEQQLATLARALSSEQLSNARFTVSGHTDDIGQVLANQKLSCGRALLVRSYLIKTGIAESRLSAYGFGSTRPVPGSATNAAENRRVELRRADN